MTTTDIESILYRTEGTDVTNLINYTGFIQQSKERAIYDITWNGEPAIANAGQKAGIEGLKSSPRV